MTCFMKRQMSTGGAHLAFLFFSVLLMTQGSQKLYSYNTMKKNSNYSARKIETFNYDVKNNHWCRTGCVCAWRTSR